MTTTLGVPKSSLLALLRVLVRGGYIGLERDRYVLGRGAVSLATAIKSAESYPAALFPKLKQLAESTDETVTLGEYSEDGRYIHYIEVLESRQNLRLSHDKGSRAPIHASSNGQALLAFMPQDLLDNLLAQPNLRALTKNTVKKRELMNRIASIRKSGVAKSIGGQEEGAMGFGSPVFDASGLLRCAIAAGGPIARVRDKERQVRHAVKQTAEEMSRLLGYEGAYPPPGSLPEPALDTAND